MVALVLVLGGCQRGGSMWSAHDVDGSLQYGGLARTYHMHLPTSYGGAAGGGGGGGGGF